jgi:hypothetical protein
LVEQNETVNSQMQQLMKNLPNIVKSLIEEMKLHANNDENMRQASNKRPCLDQSIELMPSLAETAQRTM